MSDNFRAKLADKMYFDACVAFVFDWMERVGATELRAEFSGEGDEGSFNDSLDYDYAGSAFNAEISGRIRSGLDGPVVAGNGRDLGYDGTMESFVRDISVTIEEGHEHGVDWWNNDGGRGCVQWVLDGKGDDGGHYRRGICLMVERRRIEYDAYDYAICGEVEAPIAGEVSE